MQVKGVSVFTDTFFKYPPGPWGFCEPHPAEGKCLTFARAHSARDGAQHCSTPLLQTPPAPRGSLGLLELFLPQVSHHRCNVFAEHSCVPEPFSVWEVKVPQGVQSCPFPSAAPLSFVPPAHPLGRPQPCTDYFLSAAFMA